LHGKSLLSSRSIGSGQTFESFPDPSLQRLYPQEAPKLDHMVSIEVRREDLLVSRADVQNLAGVFFAGYSPLMRPFVERMKMLLPEERRLGDPYVFGALRSEVAELRAHPHRILVVGRGGGVVEILRADLEQLIADRYPTFGHEGLNLPGLLFLQSSPSLQNSALQKLRQEHSFRIPEGRRTQRFVFHTIVAWLEADSDNITIEFDLDRLPQARGAECRG